MQIEYAPLSSVRASVCPSHAGTRITWYSPSRNPGTLVFETKLCTTGHMGTPTARASPSNKTGCVKTAKKKQIFDQKNRYERHIYDGKDY